MSETKFLPRAQLSQLLETLTRSGYAPHGPQLRDNVVTFAPLHDVHSLPHGVRDIQAPGHYRLHPEVGKRAFAYACGPQALKPLLFASRELLWEATVAEGHLQTTMARPALERPLAVIGVRACDLAALALHDAHFMGSEHKDHAYAARRERLFLVAVNCSHPSATCFCASTGDGPNATVGFDLLLDELEDGFVVRAGSSAGESILQRLDATNASPLQLAAVGMQRQDAAAAQTRTLPGRNMASALNAAPEHPHWSEIASRCLSCGNCTSVCPTCFCNAHGDEAALDGSVSRHYRVWDSCFTEGHSYIHGIVIRGDTRKRYRQWLTHKLAGWHEQYGRSGCVGCGRCITWCPAGIDFTEEAAAIVGEVA